jgi:hypothetical protein
MTAIDLNTLTLTVGAHADRGDGLCLLEAVAWQAGEEHTDRPACVSPVLAAFGRSLNDVLPDGKRQELIPLVPLLPGTAGDGRDEARGYMALDWLIRTFTPGWLTVAGLADEARSLRDLRPITGLDATAAAAPVVQQVSQQAAAAVAAARAGAWAGAWAAARAGAWAGAWAAACAGARAGAWAGAWAAACAGAWDAARAATRFRQVQDALTPTVASLQDSAISLYQAMIRAEAAS